MSEQDASRDRERERGLVSRVIEDVLIGTVESIARAGAKALESLASDASKITGRQKKKIDAVVSGIKTWREINVGEIADEDVPSELRD